MNKKELQMLSNYNNSHATDLFQVYGSYSREKAASYEKIRREMVDNDGYGLRITSKCTSNYSCAYKVEKENKTFLVYHTFRNRFEFAI